MAATGPSSGHRAGRVTVCDGCGATAPSDPPPPTWSTGVERGRPQRLCPDCTRSSLRGIEARLDPQWW